MPGFGGLGAYDDQSPYGPRQILPVRPGQPGPPVRQIPQSEMDPALEKAASVTSQVALPLGLAAVGGPAALSARALGPAIMQSLLGPFTSQQPGVLAGAVEPTPQTKFLPAEELTAERVLQAAANKKKLTYADWSKANPPGSEEKWVNPATGQPMFDFSGAQPAEVPPRAPVPRYTPPRGTSARMADALADPQVGNTLRQAVKDGINIMPEDWYANSPLYHYFEQQLGDQAPQSFQKLMQYVASTSPKSKVPDNVRQASYYHYLEQTGQPVPAKPAKGYGSIAQRLHLKNVGKIRDTGGLDPIKNPKPTSFGENLMGNEDLVTIDTHNFRLLGMARQDPRFLETRVPVETKVGNKKVKTYFNPQQAYLNGQLTMEEALKNPTYWASAPKKNEYAAYEAYQQNMAKDMGMTPANMQGKMWVGGGMPTAARSWSTGLGSPPESFLRTTARRVLYTAAALKANPNDVLSKFVRGEIPLMSIGAGAIGLGSLTPPAQQRPPSSQGPRQ